MTPILRANLDEAVRALAAARRDNEMVYHDRLVDPKTLDAVLAQPIAKPTPVTFPLTPDFRGYTSIISVRLSVHRKKPVSFHFRSIRFFSTNRFE